jgi:hypothetical protein
MPSELALMGKGVSLNAFLKENAPTLTTMGVLGGLAVLSQGIENPAFKSVLSCIWIAGMLLVWWELMSVVPQEASVRLFVFQYVWLSGGIVLGTYCLYQYRMISSWILWALSTLLIMVSILGLLIPILKHFEASYRFFGLGPNKMNLFQRLALAGLILIVVTIATFAALFFVFGANVIVEVISRLTPSK